MTEQLEKELIEIITRIDERTKTDLPEIKEHLKTLNGTMAKHSENLAIINTTVYGKNGDPGLVDIVEGQRKGLLKVIIIVAMICGSLGYGIPEIVKLFTG